MIVLLDSKRGSLNRITGFPICGGKVSSRRAVFQFPRLSANIYAVLKIKSSRLRAAEKRTFRRDGRINGKWMEIKYAISNVRAAI